MKALFEDSTSYTNAVTDQIRQHHIVRIVLRVLQSALAGK